MRRRRLHCFLLLLAGVLTAAPADGAGYWNVPSSLSQCMGCGWGAGYHAPLVLGPVSHHEWHTRRHFRLPHSPRPPYWWHVHGPHGAAFHEPSVLAPSAVEPAEPYFEPLPGAGRVPLRR